jgi:hypothetical protein
LVLSFPFWYDGKTKTMMTPCRFARFGFVFFLALAFFAGALPASAEGFDPSHRLYARVLKDQVRNGRVDYSALKSDARLEGYLLSLSSVSRADFDGWDANQQTAYLINLYNAATLALVAGHYPISSIKDIGAGFSVSPWDKPVVRLFGKNTTLNAVETLLRRDYEESRIHLALVRASKGSPPLRGEPYLAARLSAQLDDQARRFLSDPDCNRVDAGRRVLHLSPVFHWYKDDFERQFGSIQSFVQPYFPHDGAEPPDLSGFSVKYEPFNWSLNEFKKEPPAPVKPRKRRGR